MMNTAYDKAVRFSNVLDCVRDIGFRNHDENDAWVILDDFTDMDLFDRIHEVFERHNIEVHTRDNADVCIECFSLIETGMTHNGWIPDFSMTEHGYVCNDCVRKYPDDYIVDYIDDPTRKITFFDAGELEEMGWILESERNMEGMGHYSTHYAGDKMKSVQQEYPDHNVVLVIEGIGQFQTYYSVMIKPCD